MKKLLGLGVLVLMAAAVGAYVYFKNCYESKGPLAQPVLVVVPKGANSRLVGQSLYEAGVISQPMLFRLAARFTGLDKHLKAGEYLFEPKVSMAQVLDKINGGDIYYRKLTLPEGLTSAQMVEILNHNDILSGEVLDVPAEGSLLPETYSYKLGDTKQDVLNDAQNQLKQVLDYEWKHRNPDVPVNSPEELLILASIIEKETGVPQEREIVSSVFANRLKIGMRLQTDPTVIYALTQGKSDLRRSLTRKDLKIDSPYNTYQNLGLPPTPICNPGKDSIHAAAHPADTDFIFFVADGNGGHNFARTLKEHNQNIKSWLEKKRKDNN